MSAVRLFLVGDGCIATQTQKYLCRLLQHEAEAVQVKKKVVEEKHQIEHSKK